MDQAWILCRYLPTQLMSSTTQEVPSWNSINNRIGVPGVKTEIAYLPLWDSSPTELSTVYTVMQSLQDITRHLGQLNAVVTFDQAVYRLAKEIQWKRPEQFSDMVVRMGGFHIVLNYLGTIGKMIGDAGINELLVDANMYSEATVGAILKGKNYNRSIRAHKLLREALGICEWREYINSGDIDENSTKALYEQAAIVSRNCSDQSNHLKESYDQMVNQVYAEWGKFTEFRKKLEERSHLAKFWLNYMNAVDLLLTFIRAERLRDWKLHLECVKEMAKYFHGYDRPNYSRWLSVYIADMTNLQNDAPEVHKEFLDGNFSVQHSCRAFSSVWTDMALEQSVNRDVKIAGGLTGITRKEAARDRWFLTLHINSIIANLLTSMENVQSKLNCSKHGEDQLSRTAADYKSVSIIVNKLESSCRNPFVVEDDAQVLLSNICTGSKPLIKNAEKILQATEFGEASFQKFVTERLITGETEFLAPIPKLKIPSFVTKSKSTNKKHKGKSLANDRALFGRLVVVAQTRKLDLPKLFHHELSKYPLSLADNDGSMRKCQKSQLMVEIEKDIKTLETEKHAEGVHCAYVIDAMALIQKMKPTSYQTFGDYGQKLLKKVKSNLEQYDRVDLVFDRYDGEKSIKNIERFKRGATSFGEVIIHSENTPIPNWRRFVSCEKNKTRLCNFLVNYICERSSEIEKMLVLGGGSPDPTKSIAIISGQWDVMPALQSDHEEADIRMILHAKHAFENGYEDVTICSPDTDVFVISAYHLHKLKESLRPNIRLWFHTGNGIHERILPVHR